MVDFYGRWTWDSNYPKRKWCYCDHIADWICKNGYKVNTTIENLVLMIILHFDNPDNHEEYGEEFSLESCVRYIEDSGGLREFDYYI